MITLEEYLMGRQIKYPSDYTPAIKAAAIALLNQVNDLLALLNYDKPVVSSGWRPPEVNTKVGGKPFSNHMTGHAIDIADADRTLTNLIKANMDVLETCKLYLEDPESTKTWVHLQNIPPKSGKIIFKP